MLSKELAFHESINWNSQTTHTHGNQAVGCLPQMDGEGLASSGTRLLYQCHTLDRKLIKAQKLFSTSATDAVPL